MNYQISQERLEYFAKTPTWTVKEFVCITFGIDSKDLDFRDYNHKFKTDYKSRYSILLRAIYAGEIKAQKIPTENEYVINTVECIEWSKSKNITLPENIEQLVEKYSHETQDYRELEKNYQQAISKIKSLEQKIQKDSTKMNHNKEDALYRMIAMLGKLNFKNFSRDKTEENMNANNLWTQIDAIDFTEYNNFKIVELNTFTKHLKRARKLLGFSPTKK